jgi:ATP-binding cassette, subfamily B, bacterial
MHISSQSDSPQPSRITAELRLILQRSRAAWRLIARRSQWALGGAALVMAVTSGCNTGLALLLGRLVDGVQLGIQQGRPRDVLLGIAALELGLIATTYLVRESLNVVRRALVARVCSHVNRDVSLRLIGHLLTIPLATLSREMVGTLHGRILRSVAGLVRFLQLNFLDFLPALLTGAFALAAAVSKQPLLGLVMAGVIPTSFVLTARQIMST